MYGELFEEVANELGSFLKFLTIAVIVPPKLELVLKGQ